MATTISGSITLTYDDSSKYSSDLVVLTNLLGNGHVSNLTHDDVAQTISVTLTNYS